MLGMLAGRHMHLLTSRIHCRLLRCSAQEKELLITVRGTAQVEDIVTDLTAYPRVCFPML